MKKTYTITVLLFLSSIMFCQSSDDIIDITIEFINSLQKEELVTVNHDFEDTLRTRWTNLPVGLAKRPGISYGELSEESKIRFNHLLTTLLSSQGYLKITSIMNLDDILNIVYKTAYERKTISGKVFDEVMNLDWNYKHYFISIWGEPQKEKPWGLKFEGHHISLNLSVAGDKYSLTPLFLGTDPAEVTISKYAGLRVLSKEEDYGIKLINSLNKEEKLIATLSKEVLQDIITNPTNKNRITQYQGIKASDFNKEQKELFELLIKEYIGNLEYYKANEYLDKIKKSGIDEIYFAWIGSYERRKPNYYIVNGPDFLIEYDNVGFQKDGNHIHSIWREKNNDFGEDILKKHYVQHKH